MVHLERSSNPGRAETLLLALAVTLAFIAVPNWLLTVTSMRAAAFYYDVFGRHSGLPFHGLYFDFLTLLFGLLLVAGAPRKYGLCLGDIGPNWPRVLVVIAIPLAVATIGCQLVPLPAWVGQHVGIWLISPLAQDVVFAGFLYTTIERAFPGDVHPRVPVRKTLLISGVFFALHHVPNFLTTEAWFVWLQLGFTFGGFALAGLTRQWTGSLLYVTVAHSAGNLIAWWFAPRPPVV